MKLYYPGLKRTDRVHMKRCLKTPKLLQGGGKLRKKLSYKPGLFLSEKGGYLSPNRVWSTENHSQGAGVGHIQGTGYMCLAGFQNHYGPVTALCLPFSIIFFLHPSP